MIEITNISRRFGPTVALHNVSFNINAGDVIGILGPNGSGKTTLINILLGILRPDSGEVRFEGAPIWSNRQSILPKIGAVIEIPRLYPRLNGFDNLNIFATYLDIPDKEKRITDVIKQVGLAEAGSVTFENYSLGMKQRLGIALSMLNDPDIMVFDEPTNGLDPEGIVNVRDIIKQLAEAGKTVILCSHLIVEVEQVCNRVVILRQGNLVRKIEAEELDNREKTYSVEVNNDSTQKLKEKLQTMKEIRIVSTDRNTTKIKIGNSDEEKVLKSLVTSGVGVRTFSRSVQSLETIFMETLK